MNGRFSTLAAMLGGVTVLLATAVAMPVPLYVWNASESVPLGLYRLRPADKMFVTELVAVQPPEPLATFLDLNGYLPVGIPMLKRVLALPGQTVCREGSIISVDTIAMGEARERDSRGRPLPAWHGCRVVGEDELFLMNWQSKDSLDGRYFGPIAASAVIGRAFPVWTEEERSCVSPLLDLPFLGSTGRCTIPPSRPTFAMLPRAAAVQGGREAGAKQLYPGRARARRHACVV